MFSDKTKTVFVFSAQDNGAPKLTASKGSLKTLLKACLITGYGEKKALGWEMPFEDTNSAVFRSKAIDSNQFYLKINNDIAEKYAIFEPYRQMTGLDAGTGYFGYGSNGSEQRKRFGYIENSATTHDKWWLVGHDKAFILLISRNKNSVALFFGDIPSVVVGDTGNTVFWTTSNQNDYKYLYASSLPVSSNDNNAPCIAKTWDGRDTAAWGYFVSFAQLTTGISYPDKITGGLIASELFVMENSNVGVNLRAEQIGLLRCMHNLDEFPDGTDMGLLDGDDSRYLKFSLAEDYNTKDRQYLLNITRWRD